MRLSFLRAWSASVAINNLHDPTCSSIERSLSPPTVTGPDGTPFSRWSEASSLISSYPSWLCESRLSPMTLDSTLDENDDYQISLNLPFPPLFPVTNINLLTFKCPTTTLTTDSTSTTFQLTDKGLLSYKYPSKYTDPRETPTLTITCSNSDMQTSHSSTSLLTTSLSNYSPSLVGKPGNFFYRYRRIMYRFTQAMVHRFVMWRFHRYVWKRLGEQRVMISKVKVEGWKRRIKELEEIIRVKDGIIEGVVKLEEQI
ncbi:hypothetical protein TrLO_g3526 [Triparma laevis f. longispina]|uniref:Uncharacterized protein n=1 Tax=Triparma laevis f. longispina TaxID=1714387 RepID=A0A9W7CD98_9STRA|nr:hypothetical protein TrLO_g3526 [Triparma laevis f. longispina]